jgi:uncharacterized protein (TIGR02598 family)
MEVVIAVGIISFAAIAIIGLFSVGLQGSRESSEDTSLALMTQQVDAWSRSQAFTNLTAASNRSSANPAPRFYFNVAAELARNAQGEPTNVAAQDSYYACTISWVSNAASTNFVYLRYRFEWPLSAPTAARQQRMIVSSRANEE